MGTNEYAVEHNDVKQFRDFREIKSLIHNDKIIIFGSCDYYTPPSYTEKTGVFFSELNMDGEITFMEIMDLSGEEGWFINSGNDIIVNKNGDYIMTGAYDEEWYTEMFVLKYSYRNIGDESITQTEKDKITTDNKKNETITSESETDMNDKNMIPGFNTGHVMLGLILAMIFIRVFGARANKIVNLRSAHTLR